MFTRWAVSGLAVEEAVELLGLSCQVQLPGTSSSTKQLYQESWCSGVYTYISRIGNPQDSCWSFGELKQSTGM